MLLRTDILLPQKCYYFYPMTQEREHILFAEAKIELNEIDQAMLDASINKVRARACKVTPSISTNKQPNPITMNLKKGGFKSPFLISN